MTFTKILSFSFTLDQPTPTPTMKINDPTPAILVIQKLAEHLGFSEERAISEFNWANAEGFVEVRYNPKYPNDVRQAIAFMPRLGDFLRRWEVTPRQYANALEFMHSIDIDEELSGDDEITF